MQKNVQAANDTLSLENIISSAIQIPGIRVDRNEFLAKIFPADRYDLQRITACGPVYADVPREELARIANKQILSRTSQSSLLSFVSGLPGGFLMAAAIPADVMQFFASALCLAQELSYLYGEADLWKGNKPDSERVRNQLLLYCGVMFSVSGAAAGVRLLSSRMATTALKQLPKMALTKAFWYPLVKQIGKVVGVKVTKSTVAKGVSKIIPVVGGVVSGSLNFASMLPMGKRLQSTLDEAHFSYTESEMHADFHEITHLEDDDVIVTDAEPEENFKDKVSSGIKNVGDSVSSLWHKPKKAAAEPLASEPVSSPDPAPVQSASPTVSTDEIIGTIKKLAELRNIGALTQEEFDAKKIELLARL